VLATASLVRPSSARTAPVAAGWLASMPSNTTGRSAASIRRAASAIAAGSAAPWTGLRAGVSTSPKAAAFITSLGRLRNAAPGRPDSAARNEVASASEIASAESISAEYLVTGRNIAIVSMV
jgi:hypothetical protein